MQMFKLPKHFLSRLVAQIGVGVHCLFNNPRNRGADCSPLGNRLNISRVLRGTFACQEVIERRSYAVNIRPLGQRNPVFFRETGFPLVLHRHCLVRRSPFWLDAAVVNSVVFRRRVSRTINSLNGSFFFQGQRDIKIYQTDFILVCEHNIGWLNVRV